MFQKKRRVLRDQSSQSRHMVEPRLAMMPDRWSRRRTTASYQRLSKPVP